MSGGSRRIDWALLLPSSVVLPVKEVLVLGGSDELGQSLVDHGVAASWRRPLSRADRSAFVVAWEDCQYDLARIVSHVGPNGLLYMEIDRGRLGFWRKGFRRLGQRTVRRGLARGGCQVFSTHIVTPDLVEPRRYLPMDQARAIRWHLRALFVAGTPATRAARACLSAVLATPIAGAVIRLVTMRYVIIGRMAKDSASPLGVPMARSGERVIVVTSGYDQASRAVVLPFEPGDRSPRFAVKVASGPRTAVGTLREHERLVRLHATLPSDTARALPGPMGMYTLAGRTACVQSCARGPSMNVTVGRWGQPWRAKCHDLDVVVDWLIEFAAATRVDVATAESDWTLIYDRAVATFDFPPEVVDFIGEAQRIARSTQLGEFAVHQHYDVAPWNIHIDTAEPMLIDWETDDLRPTDCLGPALADVLYLVMYWYFLASGAESENEEDAAIVRLFATLVPADAGVVAARAAIDLALVSLGLERQAVPAVLAALWAEQAVYTRRRRARLGVPIDTGRSRPEAFLRILAGVTATMCGRDGVWASAVGSDPS
jgi:hypothetical protein